MGFSDVVKILFVPGLIALALYILISHALLPLYRTHRDRYAQYLPLQTITSTSITLWDRLSSAFTNWILPRRREVLGAGSGGEEESFFGEEEGESMVGFDFDGGRGGGRRERVVVGGGGEVERGRRWEREVMDSQRRLSRDLEEGFKDDSDEEDDGRDDRRR